MQFKTCFSLSNLIHNMYGNQSYLEIKDFHDHGVLQKYLLKLSKSLKYSIESTILIIDKKHLTELLDTIDHFESMIHKSNSINDLYQIYLSHVTTVCFMLIGDFPRRWKSQKVRNTKELWNLSSFRQIIYTQTNEQKKKSILSAIQNKYKTQFPEWSEFVSKILHQECSNDTNRFIDWFKKNHPDIYLSLF